MDMAMLTGFFMWGTILNAGLLLLSFFILIVFGERVYRMHSRWFPMPRETFNVIFYSFLGAYKIVIWAFYIVPWAVLTIIG